MSDLTHVEWMLYLNIEPNPKHLKTKPLSKVYTVYMNFLFKLTNLGMGT